MSREPHRWKPHWSHERVDETKCRASVSAGRIGLKQCGNKPKAGTEWCGKHTVEEVAEDAPRLWGINVGYGSSAPEIVSFAIVKETKKQIVLEETDQAFNYKTRLGKKKDGSPERGYRSRLEAAQAFVTKAEIDIKRAERALLDAEKQKERAMKLLAGLEECPCGYCGAVGVEMEVGDPVIQGLPRCVDAEACDERQQEKK